VAAARYGAATRLIGALGNDSTGAQLREFMRGAGIGDSDVRAVEDIPTGQAYICLAANGDNLIVVTPGSNSELGPADIAAARLEDGRVFLSQFETPFAALEAFFRWPAARAGIKILNAAPALTGGKYLFALADIVIVNQTELEHFSGLPVTGLADIAPAARVLRSANQTVIVTAGREGVVAVDGETVSHVAGHAVTAIDTVGAGDCFCGVLAAALDEGVPMVEALRAANAAAALSVGRRGAAAAMPDRDEVRLFLG